MDMDLENGAGSSFTVEPSPRSRWAAQRLERETRQGKARWLEPRRLRRQCLELADRALGQRFMRPVTRGAYNPRLTELELGFPNLPQAFDGYRLLHLSDLHFDRLPGIEHIVAGMTRDLHPDLAVLTGDYQDRRFRPGPRLESRILGPMRILCQAIHARDGVLATLGNHDSVHMIEPFESLGLRFLCNETVRLGRGNECIHITGLDDVHRFYTPMATAALRAGHAGFKIVLVHTADLYEEAAKNGYALQLSGHTHGGQICLPGGVPILTNLRAGRPFASGVWRQGGLTGITNRGAGTAGVRLRLFCPGEVLVVTLRRCADETRAGVSSST